jgi:hypothetical protein
MTALFEAYRPRTLAEVVGQDAVVRQVRAVLARRWGGRRFAWRTVGAPRSAARKVEIHLMSSIILFNPLL